MERARSETTRSGRIIACPPASAARNLCGGDFVVKRETAYLLDLLECSLDGGHTDAACGLPEREHSNGPRAVAQIERVIGVATAGDGLAKVGNGPLDCHGLSIEAVRVRKDRTWRGIKGGSGLNAER